MNNFARLVESSPFYGLFEGGKVPVVGIFPALAECEGDGVQEVYMVDIDRLSAVQISAILDVLGGGDKELRLEAARDIKERGLPLRAKNVVSIISDVPWFL
jgi:hypothetical protein